MDLTALRQQFASNTVVLLGGGKSLTGYDFNALNRDGVSVMAVKGSIFDLPWAACGFGLDKPRFIEWRERLATEVKMPVFWAVGSLTDQELQPKPDCVTFIKRDSGVGLSHDVELNYGGGSSGFGALGLAYALGATRIVLAGYDYSGGGVQVHHNDAHYIRARNHDEVNWQVWAKAFGEVAPLLMLRGVHVVNANPVSGISAFPKLENIDGALASFHRV